MDKKHKHNNELMDKTLNPEEVIDPNEWKKNKIIGIGEKIKQKQRQADERLRSKIEEASKKKYK